MTTNEATAPQAQLAIGTPIQTTEAIGTLSAGSTGTILRRNKRSVTMQCDGGGIATVAYGLFVPR